ncbi:PAS domain-containing protein [Pontibacter sp. G13]|uniref:PAS domain-containing protein n=1 Tax=Pontibacter sp. G13 TaxID=3074898 RepID=UPI002889C2C9|nr:PAS domain-containing protein [Pontibacter sp. G13]WNJ18097.1 PAS domain-containing protein [Pontibacter sp. G13]
MHKLLSRQLKRIQRKSENPEDVLQKLLEVVSETYLESDRDRRKKDRSLQLMSAELLDLNRRLKEENEANIHAILEGLAEGVMTVDGQGCVKSFNSIGRQMFGLEQFEQGLKLSEFVGESDRERVMEAFLSLKSQPDLHQNEAIRMVALKSSGEEFPLSVSVSHATGQGDKQLYVLLLKGPGGCGEEGQVASDRLSHGHQG